MSKPIRIKKFLILILLILMFCNNISVTGIQKNYSSSEEYSQITDELFFSEPKIITCNGEKWVKLNETKNYFKEENSPVLPKITKVYILPFGSIITNISCILGDIYTKILDQNQIRLAFDYQLAIINS